MAAPTEGGETTDAEQVELLLGPIKPGPSEEGDVTEQRG